MLETIILILLILFLVGSFGWGRGRRRGGARRQSAPDIAGDRRNRAAHPIPAVKY